MTTSSQPAADSAPGMLITMSLRMLPVATPIASIASEPCTPMVMRSSSSEDLLCLSADGKSCVNDDDGLWDFGEPPKKSSGLQAGFGAGGHVSMDDSILGSQSSSRSVSGGSQPVLLVTRAITTKIFGLAITSPAVIGRVYISWKWQL